MESRSDSNLDKRHYRKELFDWHSTHKHTQQHSHKLLLANNNNKENIERENWRALQIAFVENSIDDEKLHNNFDVVACLLHSYEAKLIDSNCLSLFPHTHTHTHE